MINSKIHPRRVARESVLQALYAQQFSEDEPAIILNRIMTLYPEKKKNFKFILSLFQCVLDHVDWANDMIKSHLQNWEFDRVAQIDRVLLRMGICEIFYMDDIPPKVSISEMVEIAKVYSTEESSGFINGILDVVYKEFQQKNKN
ncbi:MAG: transcription antitermination factor NusB [Fidelibacterota bacterium]|jgi:N utilization substance protein B